MPADSAPVSAMLWATSAAPLKASLVEEVVLEVGVCEPRDMLNLRDGKVGRAWDMALKRPLTLRLLSLGPSGRGWAGPRQGESRQSVHD